MRPPPRPYDRVKRWLDIAVAAVALVVLAPLLALIAVGVAATMGTPVLFRQTRAGRTRRVFELVKFRTMHPVTPRRASDEARLTRFGRWLRATSLDELPSLWNVLRGDMSLVGPRPLLVEYLPRYTCEQARRHEVPPGITGLAQVRGRNALSWEQKFEFDVCYVNQRRLRLDLRILAETVRAVARREGIAAAGSATGREFVRAQAQRSGPGRVQGRAQVPPQYDSRHALRGSSTGARVVVRWLGGDAT